MQTRDQTILPYLDNHHVHTPHSDTFTLNYQIKNPPLEDHFRHSNISEIEQSRIL